MYRNTLLLTEVYAFLFCIHTRIELINSTEHRSEHYGVNT
jgi:hypothetical protein